MACAPSEDSDQPGHPPSLIRVFAIHIRKAEVLSYHKSAQRSLCSDSGRIPRLIWVFAGRKCHSVGFVMSRLILLCLTCINNTDFCYFEAFYFLKLPKKARDLCIHARVCLSPFIMSHCRQVVILIFIFHDGRRVSLPIYLLVGPRGGVRVVSLMVNGYAYIYKDNRRKHLRTHTL